jgi:hypothetical protein
VEEKSTEKICYSEMPKKHTSDAVIQLSTGRHQKELWEGNFIDFLD